jgi:hypothetical protein
MIRLSDSEAWKIIGEVGRPDRGLPIPIMPGVVFHVGRNGYFLTGPMAQAYLCAGKGGAEQVAAMVEQAEGR